MWELEDIVASLIVLIVTSVVLYDKFYLETLKDVHELLLTEQSSISSTRKTGESAIYRSMDTMHGLPLTVGLQVRYDIYKIRNGNLKDIWSLAMETPENGIQLPIGGRITYLKMNQIFNALAVEVDKLEKDSKIGIYALWSHWELLAVVLATFFYSRATLVNFTKLPQIKDDTIDTICCYGADIPKFMQLGYSKFICLDDTDTTVFKADVITYSQILDLHTDLDLTTYHYESSRDDDFQTVLIDTFNFKEIKYTLLNFVSTIASQLRSLPVEHAWSSQDTLLLEVAAGVPTSSHAFLTNQNFLIKLLGGFISGVSETVLATSKDVSESIKLYKPTIIALSEQTISQNLIPEFSTKVDSLNVIDSTRLKLSSYWFARGVHNTFFKNPQFPKFRIIYSEAFSQSLLPSSQLNQIQALTSSRIVVEKFKIPMLGPLLKTNFFDYRIMSSEFSKDKFVWKKLGIPANCLEFKVKDINQWQSENSEGELMCRGYNIGKALQNRVESHEESNVENEGWMDLGIVGKWGSDGCFYEYLS